MVGGGAHRERSSGSLGPFVDDLMFWGLDLFDIWNWSQRSVFSSVLRSGVEIWFLFLKDQSRGVKLMHQSVGDKTKPLVHEAECMCWFAEHTHTLRGSGDTVAPNLAAPASLGLCLLSPLLLHCMFCWSGSFPFCSKMIFLSGAFWTAEEKIISVNGAGLQRVGARRRPDAVASLPLCGWFVWFLSRVLAWVVHYL